MIKIVIYPDNSIHIDGVLLSAIEAEKIFQQYKISLERRNYFGNVNGNPDIYKKTNVLIKVYHNRKIYNKRKHKKIPSTLNWWKPKRKGKSNATHTCN